MSQLFDRADLVIAIGYDIVECAPAKWVARPDMTIPLSCSISPSKPPCLAG